MQHWRNTGMHPPLLTSPAHAPAPNPNLRPQIILPGKWTTQRRKERIREVLAEVGLAHAHRTIVGGTLPGGLMMRGLSGGERKRLAIATGILAAPSVLFLDEPTSGLDSFAALTVRARLEGLSGGLSRSCGKRRRCTQWAVSLWLVPGAVCGVGTFCCSCRTGWSRARSGGRNSMSSSRNWG